MSIRVVCPHCGGKILAPSQLLGRMAKCPQCGQAVKVVQPAAPISTAEPQQRVEGRDEIRPPGPQQERRTVSPRSRGLCGIVIAALALSLVAGLIGVIRLGRPGTISTSGGSAAKPSQASQATEEKKDSWAEAGKAPIQHATIRFQLAGATVRNIRMRDPLGEEIVSATKYLTLSIHILNTSATQRIDYRGWSAREHHAASLEDNLGNHYKQMIPDPGVQIPGQIQNIAPLDPGKQLDDLLVFEHPLEEIEFLRLELPAAAFGDTGSLRLQIPKEMILR